MITNADLLALDGKPGSFTVKVRQRPRYIEAAKCTACGLCTQYCPKHLVDDYNEGLALTRPIHIDYAQAVPATYYIDPAACLHVQHGTCQICVPVCQSHAIDFSQQAEEFELHVGAVVLSPGFGRINAETLAKFAYGQHPDVVTSVEFERMTTASGPFLGEMKCFSDGRHPQSIAFIQCVGSRDLGCDNGYCSSVCCMYAIKEAMVAKEHDPSVEISIYYMDIRTQGKEFDKARQRAESMGIKFIRAKVAGVTPWENRLQLTYSTLDGGHQFKAFDLVVLSVGLEAPKDGQKIADITGIALNQYGFARTETLAPLKTQVEGVIVAGAFQGPKDIPESVTQASAAAGIAAGMLEQQRGMGIVHKSYPEEKPMDEEVRIGVFVCRCGINIASVVDVNRVENSVEGMEGVVYHTDSLYSCSADAVQTLKERIIEHRLNRVVIAACSPRTHEPLFQETLRDAGLNRCLIEMVNIRDQCSWVHAGEPAAATDKSKDLVRMAVAKARGMRPLPEQRVPVTRRALIIGGGIAGMTAALTLAKQGFPSVLVEKGPVLGGHSPYLEQMAAEVKGNALVDVLTNAELTEFSGFIGNFSSVISEGAEKKQHTVDHGVMIIATGGHENRPAGYLLGENSSVLTQSELGKRLAEGAAPASVVMIQCAGSRGNGLNYCSKTCCTQAVRNALRIKELNPASQVVVLYRDMRTYGYAEDAYREARLKGLLFIPYELERKPQVFAQDGKAHVRFFDPLLQEELEMAPELIALSVGIVPDGTEELSKLLKVPLTADRFFLEAHVKLRPVELPVSGIYVCGAAHGPKPVDETIAQAQAAAAKAAIPLVKGSVTVDPIVSVVEQDKCIGCGLCASLCPFGSIEMIKGEDGKRKARTIAASCKACGICSSHCPTFAITMGGFTNEQIMDQIAAFGGVTVKAKEPVAA
ncbi:MAG: FAD-dependent oxidoreductase [Candidatus Electronema sp. V4]|uniref:FAD-dependent oxidoreductase n=1 Tax=Candidatus Electronema sp. V4 TaxID=3454756 RepID=UPI0040554C4B